MRSPLITLLLLAGCASATPNVVTEHRLERMPTVFIRVFGDGRAPRIDSAVEYRLCVDFARGTLADVLDVRDGHSADDVLANVLRGWHWRVVASMPLTDGVKCWRERLEPAPNGGGLRAVPAQAVRMLRLEDGTTTPAADPPAENDREVAFIDAFESGGLRFVMLWPHLDAGAPQPRLDAIQRKVTERAFPHLPDVVLIRAVRGFGRRLQAMYRVCFDADGAATRVVAEVPIDGAASMGDVLRRWRMQPGTPVCALSEFVFTVD